MTELELSYMFVWWSTVFGIGIVSFPIVWKLFSRMSDGGYGLTKPFGLLLTSYLLFTLSIGKLAPFSFATSLLALGLISLCSFFILQKNKFEFFAFLKKSKWIIAVEEALFASGYIFWSWVKTFQPDIAGLEKFMDVGFVNSALRSSYLPPADMWFAGKTINYYWYGHFMTAVLAKITSIPTSISYNLMLATLMGFALTAAFCVSSSLVVLTKNHTRKMVYVAGFISAILLTFGGNFHTPYFIVKGGFEKLTELGQPASLSNVSHALELGYDAYWYPDATRFIGYNPDVPDKTIHEFPMYSFVVSDLHAHLINLPLVLIFMGLLISFITETKKYDKTSKLVFLGFLLGIFFMTNTWDVGNYLLLTGVIFGLVSLFKNKFSPKTFLEPASHLLVMGITAVATALPFILNFESIAQGIDKVKSHSALWQLSLLWGFPALLFAAFVVFLMLRRKKLQNTEIITLGIFITAFVLIALPEVIYVKDIYIASHHRANTMFKLTYQSFVMTYTISGFVTVTVLSGIKKKFTKGVAALFFACMFFLILIYPTKAIDSYYGSFKIKKGLNGEKWLSERYPYEFQALSWIRENIPTDSVLLEAPGDSYTDYNVLSAYSGVPTVSGWFVHEWLWRGDASFPQARVADIVVIYTSSDATLTKNILKKYSVDYIVVGTFEQEKYANALNEKKIRDLGELVYTNGQTSIYKVRY